MFWGSGNTSCLGASAAFFRGSNSLFWGSPQRVRGRGRGPGDANIIEKVIAYTLQSKEVIIVERKLLFAVDAAIYFYGTFYAALPVMTKRSVIAFNSVKI